MPAAKPERNLEMVQMFRQGMLHREIAERYGVTEDCISQVLHRLGVKAHEGGQRVRNEARRARGEVVPRIRRRGSGLSAQNSGAMRRFGCDHETALALNRGEPLDKKDSYASRYIQQRRQAKTRKLGWEFTFPTWIALWKESGKLDERGRLTKDSYVMGRHNDVGPYSPSNVYITTLSQNFIDYHAAFRAWRQSQFSK